MKTIIFILSLSISLSFASAQNATSTIIANSSSTTNKEISGSSTALTPSEIKIRDFLLSSFDKKVKVPKEFISIKKEYDAFINSLSKLDNIKDNALTYSLGFDNIKITNKNELNTELNKVNKLIKDLQNAKNNYTLAESTFEKKFIKNIKDKALLSGIIDNFSPLDSDEAIKDADREYKATLDMLYEVKNFLTILQEQTLKYEINYGTISTENVYLEMDYINFLINMRKIYRELVVVAKNDVERKIKNADKLSKMFGANRINAYQEELNIYNSLLNKWQTKAQESTTTSISVQDNVNTDELYRRISQDVEAVDLLTFVDWETASTTFDKKYNYNYYDYTNLYLLQNKYKDIALLKAKQLTLRKKLHAILTQYRNDYSVNYRDLMSVISLSDQEVEYFKINSINNNAYEIITDINESLYKLAIDNFNSINLTKNESGEDVVRYKSPNLEKTRKALIDKLSKYLPE